MFQLQVGNGVATTINSSPVIVLLRRAEKGLPMEFVSENIGKIGYTANDLVSGRILYNDLIHVNDRERINYLYSKILESAEDDASFEYRIVSGSGDVLWVEEKASVRRDPEGRILHIYSLLFDINKHKTLEGELQVKLKDLEERGKELKCFYDVSALCEDIYSLDEMLQKIVDVIPSGWQYPEMTCSRITLGDMEFRTENFRETAWKQTIDIVSRGSPIGSLEVFYLEGMPEVYGNPFLQEEGDLLEAISKRLGEAYESRLLQKGLAYYAKMLSEDTESIKGDFLANMSHELRTPLNSIIGFSDLLLSKSFGDLNNKQLRYLSNISCSGKQLLEVINSILDFSMVESGEVELNFEDISLCRAFDDVSASLESIASKKNIILESHVDRNISTINADDIKFKQILYNLLNNAVKFTPAGGTVVFDAYKVGDRVQIDVKDNGIGISEENIKKMFQPFVQIDPFANRKYPGAGMGLTLVDRYVKMHGGDVRVESKVGEGSTFTVMIPLDRKNE